MVFNVPNDTLRIKTDLPFPVREIENTWIPMADGARLAARIWLPEDATANPVPAILEYIPYRKSDFTALRDSIRHPYFAGHGYACIRVDMRGSGDSDGVLFDEYLPQEQEDALDVLAWIAAQPWCTGEVGIIGKSWGGFNGLQIAARRPPQLKAVISLCSTDDRYADDVHYMGGCLLGSEMLGWAATMLAYNARPPDPRILGDRWREIWLDRMSRTPPFLTEWMRHQRRDDYWKHGSVCEDFSAIDCPVYAVGGWADGYTNAVFRLLAGLTAPRKGLIGPWAHEYPEVARPGPAIGFLQECLRWWDYWLKGVDTGIMDEPMLRAWIQDSAPPQSFYAVRSGRWVSEVAWPAAEGDRQLLWLNDGILDLAPDPSVAPRIHRGLLAHGLDSGVWCPYGQPAELPLDQQEEDERALCFTSAPLSEPIDILGFPEITLNLAVDRPQALLALRLCDVAPNGESTLVSWGLLNLTHRDSHENPELLRPGQQYTVRLRLNAVGHRILAGHRWRLAVSTTYWPHAWPSPELVTITLFAGGNLALPVRPSRQDEVSIAFEEPEAAPRLEQEILRPAARKRLVNVYHDKYEIVEFSDEGARRLSASGIEFDAVSQNLYTITEGEPLSARARSTRTIQIGRADWRTRVETVSEMWADADNFHLTNQLAAFEGDAKVFEEKWTDAIPRDLV